MGLEEHELRAWVRRVAHGEASRRHFFRTLLAASTPAATQDTPGTPPAFTPTRRGGGGRLRLLDWQAPTILNPHFANGDMDREASSIVYEALISVNLEGDFIPILAEDLPSFENGGRSRDGTWTTWHLKREVVWHDGKPFTADDVVFTWEFTTDPATGATSRGAFEHIRRIDKLDDHTIKVVFTEPTPLWCSSAGLILPKHLFAEYKGANARNAPYNFKPVGTGPYKIVEFKSGDVARYEINPYYHVLRGYADDVRVPWDRSAEVYGPVCELGDRAKGQ